MKYLPINLFIFCFLILSIPFELSASSDNVKQETKGDQSPVVHAPGGTINIIYNKIENTTNEMNQSFSKCFELAINLQAEKLKELNEEIAQLYIQQSGVPQEDAKEWAKDVINNALEFKKKLERQEALRNKYNKELSKELIAKTYKLFSYILELVDSRSIALRESKPEIRYEISEKFILFRDESTSTGSYTSRTLILPNENKIRIVCDTGRLTKGLVTNYPSLRFEEVLQEKVIQSFSILPKYPGVGMVAADKVPYKKKKELKNVEYPVGGDMLTKDFKVKLNETLQDFFKITLSK